MTPPSAIRDFLPLTPVAFEILLALGSEERHGYAIMQDIEERTEGAVSLHAGTLYRALSRLVDTGFLEELDERPGPDEDERRRYYRITPLGRQVAAAESGRLARQVAEAVARDLAPAGLATDPKRPRRA